MSRHILAIDIRSTAISAVLFNTGLKNSVVQNSLFVPLNHDGDNGDALANGVDTVLQQFNAAGASIVVAIPSDQVYYRTLQVPFKDEKKIRQILPFEIESFLPVKVDQLVIDFQKSVQNEQTELLATAIEQKDIQHYLDIFDSLNRSPQVVIPGSLPILIYLLDAYEGMPDQAVLLDVDTAKATLYAVSRGGIGFVRSLPANLQNEAGIDTLALQVRQTLTAYTDSTANEFTPKLVFLSGPAMRDEMKRQTFISALPWPVEFIDLRKLAPKVEVAGSTGASNDNYNPWLMDNALALAMMEAEGRNCPSFHRTSSPLRDFWTTYRSYIFTPAILLAFVLLLGLSGIMLENHHLQKQVDQIDAEMKAVFQSAFPDTKSNIPPLDHMKSKLKEIQANAPAPIQDAAKIHSIDILYEISRLIPKDVDVHFSRMVIGSESVTISGKTSAFNIVDDVKNRLEQSEWFKQVEIASANMDKSGQTVNFKFTIDL